MFSRLNGANSRHFIASSRLWQECYEEIGITSPEGAGSSLFCVAFFEVLERCRSQGLEHIDFDAILAPTVKRRVPALAFRLKNRVQQEPVSGGISATPLLIPVSLRATTPPSAFRALLNVWRRLVASALIVGAAAVVGAYYSTWHLGFSERGYVSVFAGPSWLPAIPADLLLRVELKFRVDDITPDPGLSSRVLTRRIDGVWWHTDSNGARKWGEQLRDALNTSKSHYWTAALGIDGIPFDRDWPDIGDQVVKSSSQWISVDPGDADAILSESVGRALGHKGRTFAEVVGSNNSPTKLNAAMSEACKGTYKLGYYEWHEGHLWDAISPWPAKEIPVDIFSFVAANGMLLDSIIRAESVRVDPASGGVDYAIFSFARLRRFAKRMQQDLLEANAAPNPSAQSALTELETSGCKTMADMLRVWLQVNSDRDLVQDLLKDYSEASERYGSRAGTVQSQIIECIVEFLRGRTSKGDERIWSTIFAILQNLTSNHQIKLIGMLINSGEAPADLYEGLFGIVESWPSPSTFRSTQENIGRFLAELKDRPGMAISLLCTWVPKQNTTFKERFKNVSSMIDRVWYQKLNPADLQNVLTYFAFTMARIGGLRDDQRGYLFSVGNHGTLVIDDRVRYVAQLVVDGVDRESGSKVIGGLDLRELLTKHSEWSGSLDGRDDFHWAIAAKASLEFQDAAPTAQGIRMKLISDEDDVVARRMLLLEVQEFFRGRKDDDARNLVRTLRVAWAAEKEPYIRVDLGELIVRLECAIATPSPVSF
jgi:hypothetical protein